MEIGGLKWRLDPFMQELSPSRGVSKGISSSSSSSSLWSSNHWVFGGFWIGRRDHLGHPLAPMCWWLWWGGQEMGIWMVEEMEWILDWFLEENKRLWQKILVDHPTKPKPHFLRQTIKTCWSVVDLRFGFFFPTCFVDAFGGRKLIWTDLHHLTELKVKLLPKHLGRMIRHLANLI